PHPMLARPVQDGCRYRVPPTNSIQAGRAGLVRRAELIRQAGVKGGPPRRGRAPIEARSNFLRRAEWGWVSRLRLARSRSMPGLMWVQSLPSGYLAAARRWQLASHRASRATGGLYGGARCQARLGTARRATGFRLPKTSAAQYQIH